MTYSTNWLFLFLVLLSGCVQRSSEKKSSCLHEVEARYDVPFPLGAKCTNSKTYESGEFLHLKVPQMIDQVTTFHEAEMERLGWRLEAVGKGDKLFYYWRKPTRWAAVILYRSASSTIEDLFVGF